MSENIQAKIEEAEIEATQVGPQAAVLIAMLLEKSVGIVHATQTGIRDALRSLKEAPVSVWKVCWLPTPLPTTLRVDATTEDAKFVLDLQFIPTRVEKNVLIKTTLSTAWPNSPGSDLLSHSHELVSRFEDTEKALRDLIYTVFTEYCETPKPDAPVEEEVQDTLECPDLDYARGVILSNCYNWTIFAGHRARLESDNDDASPTHLRIRTESGLERRIQVDVTELPKITLTAVGLDSDYPFTYHAKDLTKLRRTFHRLLKEHT